MINFLYTIEGMIILMGLSAALFGVAMLMHIRKEPKQAHGKLRN